MMKDFIQEKERDYDLTFPRKENGQYSFPQEYWNYAYASDLFANEKFLMPKENSMPNWLMLHSGDLFELKRRGLLKGFKILLYHSGT